jgi:Domain of unknown function (DUF4279)
MSEYEFTVSLRIRHPRIEPSKITEELGIRPQHSWKAGDPHPRRGAEASGTEGEYRDSYWTAPMMEQPQLSTTGVSVESVLVQTINQLRRSQSFLEQLSAEGGTLQLSVSLLGRENFRLELSPDTMALMGRLRIAVVLDVHPHAHSMQ